MGYAIDGPTKVISLTSGTVSVSVRDLWSRWVDWFLTSDNSKYAPAFVNVGGDEIDLTAGTSIPIYAFLVNGWRLKPQEANHTLNINDGILVVSGGGDPFINTSGSYIVRINYSQPVQAITVATGGGGGGSGGGTILREDELAQNGGWDYITLNAAASATNNLYENTFLVIVSGTGEDQVRKIVSYNGASKVAKVFPFFQVPPDNTSVYRIIP